MIENPYFLQFEIIGNTKKINFGFEWSVLAKLHPDLIYMGDSVIMIKNMNYDFSYPVTPLREAKHFFYNPEKQTIRINPTYLGIFCNANNLKVVHKISMFDYFNFEESSRTLIYFASETGKPFACNIQYKTGDMNALARYTSNSAKMFKLGYDLEDKTFQMELTRLFVMNGIIYSDIQFKKTFNSRHEMIEFVDNELDRGEYMMWEKAISNIIIPVPAPYGYVKKEYQKKWLKD